MINFKEEVSKYEPILEVDNIEDAVNSGEMQDVLDILHYLTTKMARNSVYSKDGE